MIIFLLGDSITQGYWDTKGGWADRVKAEVLKRDVESDLKHYHGVHNLGVDGNTTSQLLDRFDAETQARLWKESDYGVVIAVGTNDTVIDRHGATRSDPVAYENQLQELYVKASKLTNNVAFVNLLPVNEKLTNPLPSSSTGKSYTNDRINIFNEVLESVCKRNNAILIDARSKYVVSDFNTLLADGLHPNDKGHEIIFNSVMSVLDDWLYPSN